MALGIIDTHAHYDDNKFDGTRDTLIPSIFADGDVTKVINAGIDIKTSLNGIALAEKYEGFYAWVGIQPQECPGVENIDETLKLLTDMLSHPKVVGIGEIGLDFHWEDNPSKETQFAWFRSQMELATQLKKPVNIHDRDAHGACMDVINEYPEVKGVFHSFSGSAEMASELVKKGWMISFSGVCTFKNASRVREVVASVPVENMLLETDSPYLAPEPVRGTLNNSLNIKYSSKIIAEIKGISQKKLCEITSNNAIRFLGM